jgi:AcrR family transcriptional regulator
MTVKAIRKRITKSADERRQDLLDAALHIFAEKGIGKTTVSDVTDTAGVAKGTFYLYFGSKDHLVAALKERFVDEILEHANGLYARVGKDDWWQLVDETLTSFVDFMLERRDMIHVMVQEGETPETSPYFADCQRRIDEMFAASIKMGIDAGVFSVQDPVLIGRFLHYAMDGALSHAILYDTELDRDRLIASARELVRKVLSP